MDYDVKGNLHEVLGSLPAGVRLVAISKFHPNEYIEEAYAEGQRIFGESHEQELAKKVASLPEDIEWHFIGHLQTNKVKYIAPYISMIESVDSLKLLKEIEKQAAKHDRVVKVLLELHLAEEDTKSGLSLDACRELLEAGEWREMKHVQICGIMMMASIPCRRLRELLPEKFFQPRNTFPDQHHRVRQPDRIPEAEIQQKSQRNTQQYPHGSAPISAACPDRSRHVPPFLHIQPTIC